MSDEIIQIVEAVTVIELPRRPRPAGIFEHIASTRAARNGAASAMSGRAPDGLVLLCASGRWRSGPATLTHPRNVEPLEI